jgi:flavorubredoxin
MKHYDDETPEQVQLTISTDYGFTADFLRELANEIENSDNDIEDYETFRGVAKIEWPE